MHRFSGLCLIFFVLTWPVTVNGLRPLREWFHAGKEELYFGPPFYSSWNITGTYRGNWKLSDSSNSTSKFPNLILELFSTKTKIKGVHYVQGLIIFNDGNGAKLRVEGVCIWPLTQLRLFANSGKDSGFQLEDDYLLSNPLHSLRLLSSQVFQESPLEKLWKKKHSPIYETEKNCYFEIDAEIYRNNDGVHDIYQIEGLVGRSSVDDDSESDCFPPMVLTATTVESDVYFKKAVYYTLMVTFISFLEVLLVILQMDHSNTQSAAAKVSVLMIGHQAIMEAYSFLLHLAAGFLVGFFFNAFATAAFIQFVIFSLFEMRYLLTIWKANRRELSVLYSRFYGILFGGILIIYGFHRFIRVTLLLLHSFWIPQIVINVVRDLKKPLHPYYIVGMTVIRSAVPLYIFGCPHGFLLIEPDKTWCIWLAAFMGLQAAILLVQHFLGSQSFVPRRLLPEKYNYYRRLDWGSDSEADCAICLAPIDLTTRSTDCMVTPCDHCFHSGCLQRWMDVKMECPTCRGELPDAPKLG